MNERTATKVSRELKLSAYVVDEQVLSEIDAIGSAAIEEADADEPMKKRYRVATPSKETVSFGSLQELKEYLAHSPESVRLLELRYTFKRDAGLDIAFSRGYVRILGFSSRQDFSFNVNRLEELLGTTREEYPWAVRMLVFSSHLRFWLNVLLPVLSIMLFISIGYYIHARHVGVNVDPNLVPKGNEYYQRITAAIKSNDSNEKLNALLLIQLTHFTNVSDVLLVLRKLISYLLFAIASMLVLLFSRQIGETLYPASFYLFGRNHKRYSSLQSRRQMWGMSVVVGFAVNIAAGLLVAIALR